MKIYTSYYGNLKKLHSANIVPISISLYNPKWFKGMSLSMLAPLKSMLHGELTEEQYTKKYLRLLDTVNFKDVLKFIKANSRGNDVALLCYEKPNDFCHRHLLADFMNKKFNMNIKEFVPIETKSTKAVQESQQGSLF